MKLQGWEHMIHCLNPSIPLTNPYSNPLSNPPYNPLFRVETLDHMQVSGLVWNRAEPPYSGPNGMTKGALSCSGRVQSQNPPNPKPKP